MSCFCCKGSLIQGGRTAGRHVSHDIDVMIPKFEMIVCQNHISIPSTYTNCVSRIC